MKNRRKKACLAARYQSSLQSLPLDFDNQAWLDVSPIGREFGSKDYERLGWQDAINQLQHGDAKPVL